MLEKLKDKFVDERNAAQKEELKAKQAFEVLLQNLTDQIAEHERQIADQSERKSGRTADAKEASGEKQATASAQAEDEKYLADLNTLCRSKSQEFEDRQNLRAEEIEALGKAIEIIGSQAVKGSGEKHLPSFVQQDAGSCGQLRSSSTNLQRAAALLAERAKMYNSPALAMIAQKAQETKDDPFTKVKKMIRDLIVKLMEEAAGEADHKAWCDKELKENKLKRNKRRLNLKNIWHKLRI